MHGSHASRRILFGGVGPVRVVGKNFSTALMPHRILPVTQDLGYQAERYDHCTTREQIEFYLDISGVRWKRGAFHGIPLDCTASLQCLIQ
jgi:hypothetical protein